MDPLKGTKGKKAAVAQETENTATPAQSSHHGPSTEASGTSHHHEAPASSARKRSIGLLPCPGYDKQCCNEHWGASILSSYRFLQLHARSWIAGSYGNSVAIYISTNRELYSIVINCNNFSGGSDGKVSVYNVGDCSIPGLARSLGEGNGNPLQYYCLENPTDRGAW